MSGRNEAAADPGVDAAPADVERPSAARLVWAVRAAAVTVAAAGAAVLMGWMFGVRALTGVLPGAVSMKPNTAVCLVFLAGGLWCSVHETRAVRRTGVVAWVTPVAVVAALTAAEYLLDVDLVLDRVLFGGTADRIATSDPGRMAPNTAAALLLLAVALLTLGADRGRRTAWVSHVLAIGAFLLGVLGWLGYLYRVPELERFAGLTGMAVHTAVLVSMASLATVLARPGVALTRIVVGRTVSAMLTRRLLAATFVVLPAIGWLRLLGQDEGLFGTRLGVALQVAVNVGIFTVIIFWTGARADRSEAARRSAETALVRHAQLQAMMDNTPAGIFIKDLNRRYQLVNRQFERLLGAEPGTVVGRTDELLLDAVAAADVRLRDEAVLATEHALSFEDVLPGRHGPRTFLTMRFALRDAIGRPYAISGIATEITEQRAAATRFRSLLEAAPDPMLCVDTDGMIVLANARAEQVLGYTGEELTGQPVDMLVPQTRRSAHSRHRRDFLADSAPRQMGAGASLTARHKNGTEVPVEVSLSTVDTPEGTLVIAAVRDVTARRAAEDTNARLAGIVESSDDAIISKDLGGAVLTWNPGAEHLYGYPAEEMIGAPMATLSPPDRAGEESALLARIATGETIKHHQTIRMRKNGHAVHVSLSVSPIRDRTGTVIGASSVAHDITDRVRAETRLRQQQEHTRMIVETASDPFLSVDEHGVITEWNRRAAEVFGWPREEILGRTVAETIVPPRYHDGLRRLLAGWPTPLLDRPAELSALHHDGRELPVELSMWRLDRDRGPTFNAFLRDITVRQQAEQVLAGARDQALATSRLKSQFLASMSHEIRTPMNGVIGLTELLRTTDLTDTQRRYAEGVSAAGSALLGVINDILDFSKIEAGKVVLDETDFDLGTLIDDVLELAAGTAGRKPLELIGRRDPRLPAALRGDAGRLRQILLNLTTNAVKFTERGEVLLHASADPAGDHPVAAGDGAVAVRFEVRDTGIGIAEADRGRLFDPFTQADASTTRRFGGTGLGLAICRDLVALMGGSIGVDSRPGRGSSFWFTVGLRPAADPAAVPRSRTGRLDGLRILVVDHDDTDRFVLHDQLTAWHMLPATAESGAAALRRLSRAAATGRPFDLAILAMHLPDMSGLDLAAAISARADIPRPRLLLLSSGDELTAGRAARAGFDATLTKPVRRSHLLDVIVGVAHPIPAGATPLPAGAPAGPGRGHLLLAEDNDINQTVALGVLANLGYTADVAGNGRQAVEMAATHRYLAVLMDCQMPDMDGYAATEEIRRQEHGTRRHVPIIAMTAGALAEDRDRCLAAGMDDHLAKPVMPGTVRQVLARWSLTAGLDTDRPAGPAGPAHPQTLRGAIEQRLDQLRGPDPAADAVFLPRLLRSLADRAPQHLNAIADALGHGDGDTVLQQVHQLKGVAANLGVSTLGTLCDDLEALGRAGSLDHAPELLAGLRVAVADTCEAVGETVAGYGSPVA